MATRSMAATAVSAVPAVRASTRDLQLGGSLLFLAGGVILMGIITAEALYPGAYSTGANQISDLGGTEPPNSIVRQPAAAIFDVSMIIVGLMVLAGSWLVQRAFALRSVTIPIAILGAGALGVGLFPGDTGAPHAIFATTTFVAGGVGAITSARVTSGPFRSLSILLGAIALLTFASYLVMRDASPMAVLGIGGLERWIVYPIVVWVTGFGGHLAGRAEGAPAVA